MSKTIKTLDQNETTKFLKAVRHGIGNPFSQRILVRNYCMVLVMLDAGLRVSECCQLLVSDLYFKGEPVKEIRVREAIAKGKRERCVPVSDRLSACISEMQMSYWCNVTWMSPHWAFYVLPKHTHIVVRHVQRIVKFYGRAAIQRKVTPHMLRHTFATRLMRTTSLRIVQELLGHASITSTQVYTHPNSNDLKTAIAGMDP